MGVSDVLCRYWQPCLRSPGSHAGCTLYPVPSWGHCCAVAGYTVPCLCCHAFLAVNLQVHVAEIVDLCPILWTT
jgi:hypothetical protein